MRYRTYAKTFNQFYSVITKNRSVPQWARQMLHGGPRRRISDRLRITRHILLIRDTQRIGTHYIDPVTHHMVLELQRTLTLGWIIHHLRPLQRHIIRYLWRPEGPLYCRHRDALFKSMQGAVGAA